MITVIGYDGSPLSPQARDRLAAASLVVGGAHNLEPAPPAEDVPRIVLGDVAAALDAVEAAGGDTVVMASGDPALFGILRIMRERGLRPEVLPAVSSVAIAFARAGLPWDDAAVLSVHGRDPRHAVNACRALPKAAVLTSPRYGPAELGSDLEGWHRTMIVAEHLGMPGERITDCTPAEAAAGTWATRTWFSYRTTVGSLPVSVPTTSRPPAQRMGARRGHGVPPPRLHGHQVGGQSGRAGPAAAHPRHPHLGCRRRQRLGRRRMRRPQRRGDRDRLRPGRVRADPGERRRA